MKPQQFEELLFSGEPLSAEEQQELEAHMQGDSELAMLHHKWAALKPYLEASEMAAPEPGFAQRWRTRWEEEAARTAQRRALLLASLCGLTALGLLIAFSSVPSLMEVKDYAFITLDTMIEWFAFLQVFIRVAGALLAKVPPITWSAIFSLILALPLAWVALFKQVALAKGTIQ